MNDEKGQKLAEFEGYKDLFELLQERHTDSVVPGICTNEDCDYTTEVEPDSKTGWCEVCETNTVAACTVLAGII